MAKTHNTGTTPIAEIPTPAYDLSVLYVEDDTATREVVTAMLKRKVAFVHTATNGKEGLELFAFHEPDLVITDIRMPVMDGIEMSRELLKLCADTRIIVTTAHTDTDYLLNFIDIGITQYVLKPIDINTLFAAIDRVYRIIELENRVMAQNELIVKLNAELEKKVHECATHLEKITQELTTVRTAGAKKNL